jgi:hypothetical protein
LAAAREVEVLFENGFLAGDLLSERFERIGRWRGEEDLVVAALVIVPAILVGEKENEFEGGESGVGGENELAAGGGERGLESGGSSGFGAGRPGWLGRQQPGGGVVSAEAPMEEEPGGIGSAEGDLDGRIFAFGLGEQFEAGAGGDGLGLGWNGCWEAA